MARIRAAVLMGGDSAEREVSLASGRMVLESLDLQLYDPIAVDTGQPDWTAGFLGRDRPEVAILCLHGPGGEDGALQGFLQTLGIPFTGSGILSSALCMDKELTKRMLRSEGIPVPQSLTITAADRKRESFSGVAQSLPLPLVVKPNRQGSTRGTTKVTAHDAVLSAVDEALQYDTEALLEEYVAGVEITGAVVGGEDLTLLPLIEIVPQSGFYDYHDKYTPGATEEIIPARITECQAEEAGQYALKAHRALKCWGLSRTDMIVGDHQIWVLEVNTLPGMTPTSLVPRAASAAGMSLGELTHRLVQLARQRPQG